MRVKEFIKISKKKSNQFAEQNMLKANLFRAVGIIIDFGIIPETLQESAAIDN